MVWWGFRGVFVRRIRRVLLFRFAGEAGGETLENNQRRQAKQKSMAGQQQLKSVSVPVPYVGRRTDRSVD